jgi:hypothetical protein
MKHLAIYSFLFVSLFVGVLAVQTVVPAQAASVAYAQQYNENDISNSKIISCYNNCDFNDILRTINNLITFLITVVFVPVVIVMFMYAGFKYIAAQGDSKKLISLKSMLKHIVGGMLLILCAWLIVRTILTVVVSDEQSAVQFLGK